MRPGPRRRSRGTYLRSGVERGVHVCGLHFSSCSGLVRASSLILIRTPLPDPGRLVFSCQTSASRRAGRQRLSVGHHELAGLPDGAGLVPMDPAEVPNQSEPRRRAARDHQPAFRGARGRCVERVRAQCCAREFFVKFFFPWAHRGRGRRRSVRESSNNCFECQLSRRTVLGPLEKLAGGRAGRVGAAPTDRAPRLGPSARGPPRRAAPPRRYPRFSSTLPRATATASTLPSAHTFDLSPRVKSTAMSSSSVIKSRSSSTEPSPRLWPLINRLTWNQSVLAILCLLLNALVEVTEQVAHLLQHSCSVISQLRHGRAWPPTLSAFPR